MAGNRPEAVKTDAQQVAVASVAVREPEGLLGRVMVLWGGMRELWIVFAVKCLGVAAYAILSSTLKLWLSADLGLSDQQALGLVATWSILMTVFTVLVGSLTDAIGLRKAFLLGVVICIVARFVMTFTTTMWVAVLGGLVPLALGEALGTPVMVAGIRRYSTTAQRSISFSIFYVMMNVGFLISGFLFDWLREGLGEHGHFMLPLVGVELTTYQTLFLISLLIELLLFPLLYFGIREGAEATDEGVRFNAGPADVVPTCQECGYNLTGKVSGRCPECGWVIGSEPAPAPDGLVAGSLAAVRTTLRETGRLYATLARQSGFYRLLTFLMLIAFVKLIFMQMTYVYPTFGIRELGEGAPVGRLWVINSILIIFLVPLVGVLSQRISAYTMVLVGSAISAGAGFVMALPPEWFASLADGLPGHLLGHKYLGLEGAVHPWYMVIALYVVLLSIGEAVYSPRVYEYAASIAPKGQEASYGALSYVPFFLAKLIVGTVSGTLLARYCPEDGPRDSGTMWLIIALITMIAPVGLLTLRGYIRVKEAGRE